ncbi:hypothetical protein [Microbacterium forte]|uniref:hypothetical protein n=1 Tax=Microbacterium forte TaxID=2982533 RepID=UPI0028935FC9|nr:hypothetical protein [Microbacterium sp. A(2022)]
MKRMTLAVELEQPGTDDTIEYTVEGDNRDMVRFDLIRARKGWPGSSDAPILWATVVAYFALRRSGEVPESETVEQFIDRAVHVTYLKDGEPVTPEDALAGESGDDVDPSQPGVAPGY